MSKQPEALRIADALDASYGNFYAESSSWFDRALSMTVGDAAEELRRLHALNAELVEALRFYGESCDATETTPCGYEGNLCCKVARAAISKAEAQQ